MAYRSHVATWECSRGRCGVPIPAGNTHSELLWSDAMVWDKLECIHANPARRGYVDKAKPD